MNENVISGSSKCCECGELIYWEICKEDAAEYEKAGMITYSIICPCPKCRSEHFIDIDIDDTVKIRSTGNKVSKRDNKTYVVVNKFKSKTKEERNENVMKILVKYINS